MASYPNHQDIRPFYVRDTDPGAVGKGVVWCDTSSGPPYGLFIRKDDDTGWDALAGGGGGGLTQAYEGYNTIGGSTQAMVAATMYMKQVVLATDCLLTSIGVYVAQDTADAVRGLVAAVFDDVAGSPKHVLGYSSFFSQDLIIQEASGAVADGRWLDLSIGKWLPAGTYWIGVMAGGGNNFSIAYDGSGSDKYYTAGGNWVADAGFYTINTSANKFSIRGTTIR